MNSDTQPQMKELLGLCSGRFSDNEDSRTAKNNETQDNTKGHKKDLMFETQSNMNELLGLCSGKFTDDENKIEDDVSKSGEKDSVKSDSELDEQEDKSDDEEDDVDLENKSDNEEESDLEEMILKRKYGKKYEAKKRYPAFILSAVLTLVSKVICIYLVLHYCLVIGLRNLRPLSRPITSKTKTNHDLLAQVFSRSCNCFEF